MGSEPFIRADENADAAVLDAAWSAYEAAAAAKTARTCTVDDTTSLLLRLLQAHEHRVRYTSGGTHADALAIFGTLPCNPPGGQRPHVVTSAIEHAAVRKNLEHLASLECIDLTVVPATRSGAVAVDAMLAALKPNTKLVSLIYASNETGVRQPVGEVFAACRARGVMTHTDAVQAVGRVDIDVERECIDMLSLSAHKMGAVGGLGALLVRQGIDLEPIFGPMKEGDADANIPGIASLGAALAAIDVTQQQSVAQLRDRFEAQLSENVHNVLSEESCSGGHLDRRIEPPPLRKGAEIEIIGTTATRLPNTSCVRFVGCEADGMMMALDQRGIAASTGSACSSGSVEASPILLGMGLRESEALECLRFSFGPQTTEEDIDCLAHNVWDVMRLMLDGDSA